LAIFRIEEICIGFIPQILNCLVTEAQRVSRNIKQIIPGFREIVHHSRNKKPKTNSIVGKSFFEKKLLPTIEFREIVSHSRNKINCFGNEAKRISRNLKQIISSAKVFLKKNFCRR